MHLDVIAEIPGVELEINYKESVGPALFDKVDPVKNIIEQAHVAKRTFDLGKNGTVSHSEIKGVDDVIEIDSDSDLDDDDNKYSVYHLKLMKQEDADISDNMANSESDQDTGEDNPSEVIVEYIIEGDEKIFPQRRGSWTRTQTKQDYTLSFSSKSYSRPRGVDLSRVYSIHIAHPNNVDFLENECHFGEKIINNFTPTSEHLFQVRDKKDRQLLSEDQAQHFHHTVAQLLFLCTRLRPKLLAQFLYTLPCQSDLPSQYLTSLIFTPKFPVRVPQHCFLHRWSGKPAQTGQTKIAIRCCLWNSGVCVCV